ncbi:MAG: tetratricopeptide repeat protein, partial [candidate division KSB1 bacterium]|nr:tetratricopeptide repeat protein [candidate division KSB1 bacterium]
TGIGIGAEGLANYFLIKNRLSITLSAGFGWLNDGFLHHTFNTNLLTLDVKGTYWILPVERVNPYVFVGCGIINSYFTQKFNDRFYYGLFDGAFMLGGGIEYLLSPKLGLNLYLDYRHTTGDDLDNFNHKGPANDGYLNGRLGVTFYLKEKSLAGREGVIAEKAPIEEAEFGDKEMAEAFKKDIEAGEQESETELTTEQYVKLKSKVDNLNWQIQQKEREIEELKIVLAARKEKVSQLEAALRTRGGTMATALNLDLKDFNSSYEVGLERFYAREYEAAIYVFNMLLEADPQHKLAGNCQYWIGECYFGSGNYTAAIDAFQKVLNYPQSFKRDDALLMLGRCYLEMGNKELAHQMFDQLIQEFPDSEYISKAERYVGQ